MSTSVYSPTVASDTKPLHMAFFDLPIEDHDFTDESANLRWSNSAGKRAFDLAVAAPALLLSLPILVGIAVVIRASSDGPVLFRQTRMGKSAQPFTIYKFRTMRPAHNGPSVTRKGDARLTKLGLLLRRLKLDELPQLYNVVRGDMSLVGPRPKVIGHELRELPCRPGITGAATLLFAREEDLLLHIPEDQVEHFTVKVLHPIKARLDRVYAQECNFFTDAKILAQTALRLGRRQAITSLPELASLYPAVAPISPPFDSAAR